jgi:delta 1-pyrroline-5-carboxylate dehydrogenase
MLFVKEKIKALSVEIKADSYEVRTGVHCNINESLALWTQKALQTNEQVSDNYLYD